LSFFFVAEDAFRSFDGAGVADAAAAAALLGRSAESGVAAAALGFGVGVAAAARGVGRFDGRLSSPGIGVGTAW
jgi:hypothetical protein